MLSGKMLPDKLVTAIDNAARGSYQSALLRGDETWSGSSLKGKARTYGAAYASSRYGLLRRVNRSLAVRWPGWHVETALVATDRTRRQLVVVGPGGGRFAW